MDSTLPLVKQKFVKEKGARQFLKDLGIPELDIVAEVMEKVLPKYDRDVPVVSFKKHKHDIGKIERAYSTDSNEKKERLVKKLQLVRIIWAYNPNRKCPEFRKPCETYFKSDELQTYFAGNTDVWFVSPQYHLLPEKIFQEAGVADSVRIKCKAVDRENPVIIRDFQGLHERGLSGFDPDINVDGIEYAVAHPTEKRSLFIWTKIAIEYSTCIQGVVEKSKRKTYEDSKKENEISEFGRLLIGSAWLPGPDGKFHKASDLTLDELPESFSRDKSLADQLGMKKNVIGKLAEEAGVPAEDIELLKQYPKEFQEWKAAITARKEEPAFPKSTAVNHDRREERLLKQLAEASEKKYEKNKVSVRITRGTVDPALGLRNRYTNETGQMVCQICKKEMPFRKRDGEYYFEAVEALSINHFTKEHEAQFLALCPLCAAMYKEFVKQDEDAMEIFKNALMNSDKPELSLQLGDLNTSVRFVESHWLDIRTILQEIGKQL
jgi:hypothetical protein